jgi:polyphosphate kinase
MVKAVSMLSSLRNQKLQAPLKAPDLLDRDHSILAFNERVLDWAVRDDVPLLERLRYLCIVSSNLDEFFEVRAEPHLIANQANDR